jgi:hypothetical protein
MLLFLLSGVNVIGPPSICYWFNFQPHKSFGVPVADFIPIIEFRPGFVSTVYSRADGDRRGAMKDIRSYQRWACNKTPLAGVDTI